MLKINKKLFKRGIPLSIPDLSKSFQFSGILWEWVVRNRLVFKFRDAIDLMDFRPTSQREVN
jgi:hypothetical protein